MKTYSPKAKQIERAWYLVDGEGAVLGRQVRLSGEKEFKKIYYRHSQYPGGLHETPYERLAGRHPERVVEQAVRGMLPKSRLGRKMAGKLHVYAGAEHPHEAQGPVVLRLGDVPGAASGKG
jgi:large subunit ribosomal protein L13